MPGLRPYKMLISLLPLLTASCGPRLKRASDVAYLFSKPPASVSDIATSICQSLGKREALPNTKGMLPQIGSCDGAGLAAVDFNKISSFTFTDLPGQTVAQQAKSDVFTKSIRTQLWLNRTIPDLLVVLSDMMKQGDLLAVGEVKLPESVTKNFENLLKPVIKITEKPSLNIDDLTFSLRLNVVTSGAVLIANDITLNGKLFNNGIAVTISTTKPYPAYEKSILQSFDIVFLVIPYANDVYLDMAVNLNIYNIGLNGPIDKNINSIFGTALKTLMDTIIKVGVKS